MLREYSHNFKRPIAASVVKITVETRPVHKRVMGIFTHGNLELKNDANSPLPIQRIAHINAEKKAVSTNFDRSPAHEVQVKKVSSVEPNIERTKTLPYSFTLLLLWVMGFSKIECILFNHLQIVN